MMLTSRPTLSVHLNVGLVLNRRRPTTSLFFTAEWTYILLFCEVLGVAIINSFSSENHILKSTACSGYLQKSCFDSSYLASLLASVSSWAAFLFRHFDSYAKRGICCPRVSVCVCVCVSVTLRYCIKTAKRRITQITPHDSPLTLVFWCQSSLRNSNGITPYGGDKCRWGGL